MIIIFQVVKLELSISYLENSNTKNIILFPILPRLSKKTWLKMGQKQIPYSNPYYSSLEILIAVIGYNEEIKSHPYSSAIQEREYAD